MPILKNPEWLAILPVLALAGWYWRRLELWRPLRVLLLVLLGLILARPQMRLFEDGMDLFVLLDRSLSTEDKVDRGLQEWTGLLERNKRSQHDKIVMVDYAADVLPAETRGGQPFSGNRSLTRTNLALQNVLAMRDKERPARILLFTDGYSTESLTGMSDKLQRENVPLDIRFLMELKPGDFQISRLQLPQRAQVNEPLLLEVEVSGEGDAKVPLAIFRGGQKLTETQVALRKGRGVARFTDRLAQPGAHKYEAMITPANDPHPGNNRYENWTEIVGGPRFLLVTKYAEDPVEDALKQQGFEVETVRNPGSLQAGQLAGCRAIILNNVPAPEVPAEFLASLDFFVTQQAGGLLMIGGKTSFGAGGYFQSAVDPLLPVSMEMKMDQRKLAVAMAIVMDRSGSMGASVPGGHLKMDLANEGAAKAIEMLGYRDSIAVYAVDSSPHEVFGMQQVGTQGNKQDLMEACRRIQVGGGGIFTYTGLKAGWDALKDTSYGTRHLILFADAADAEEPGDYKILIDEMVKEQASISVIALGTKMDPDAAFLEDVASRGMGRIFFTNEATELPNIFTQETVAVARSAFIKDPVSVNPTGGWMEISGKDFAWLTEVDGFNLSYKRDWASQALVTGDEYAAPLLAWGQRGLGRTAAVSFAMGGEYSEKVRAWPKYGDFVQTLGRWLMGDEIPAGLGLRHQLVGTDLRLDLLYEGEWEEKFAQKAPRIVIAEGQRAEILREITWRRMAPGHYSVSTDLTEGQVVRGVIQVDKHALPFGPIVVGSSAEWKFDPARIEELRQTSKLSGGRELVNLEDAWISPPVTHFTDLRPWLLLLALGLVITEALITRMGWTLPEFTRRRPKVAADSNVIKAPSLAPESTALPTSPSAPSDAPAVADATPDVSVETQERRSRFARAKKR